MKLLNTYENRDEAELALTKISGEKRLASERDSTEVIYNLFGIPSWGNFLRLDMYNLIELRAILDKRSCWNSTEVKRHKEIISTLNIVARNYEINIPNHWL